MTWKGKRMEEENKITGRVIAGSLLWKLLERFFSQGVNLVVQIVLARLLLPEDFSSLAIIAAITNFASVFVQTGLATALVQKEDVDEQDVNTLFTASICIAGILYVILFLLSPWIASYYRLPELKWAVRALALILFLNAVNAVQSAQYSRSMQFKKLFLRSAIAVPLSGALGIILAVRGFGVWALIAQSLSNMLLVVIFMSIDNPHRLRFGFSPARARRLYSFSVKILLSGLVSQGTDTLRTMIIGRRFSKNDLAYYDKAYTYSYYAVNLVNSSVTSVLLPVFSRKQNEPDALLSMSRRSVSLTAFVIFPALLGLAAVSEPLILLLLTEKWRGSIPFLMVFCVLRLPGFIVSVDKQVLFALGRSEIGLNYEITVCALNLILLLFTARISPMAIALGATAVEFIGAGLMLLIARRVYGYSLSSRAADLGRPLLHSLVMSSVVYCLRTVSPSRLVTLIVQVAAGAALYLMLAAVTRDPNLKLAAAAVKRALPSGRRA